MASLPPSADSAQANAPPSEAADEASSGLGEVSSFAYGGIPAVVGHMVGVLRGCKRAAESALLPPPAPAPPLRITGPAPGGDPADAVGPPLVDSAPDPSPPVPADPQPPELPAPTEQQSGEKYLFPPKSGLISPTVLAVLARISTNTRPCIRTCIRGCISVF